MANRRCFSGKITESDSFYALGTSAQALYLHLCLHADDDGFLNNAASIASQLPKGIFALRKLVEARFLLQYGDIYVIKHWRVSNTLKNERGRPLAYASIAERLWIKENQVYTDHPVKGGVTLLSIRKDAPPEYPGPETGSWEEEMEDSRIKQKRTEENRTEENRTEENKTELKEGSWADGVWSAVLGLYPQEKLGDAEQAHILFRQAVTDAQAGQRMLENLKLWKQSQQWSKEGGRYIPYLGNWIQRGIWQGKPERLVLPTGASGQLGEAELEAIRRVLREG